MPNNLSNKHCVPCEGGVKPYSHIESKERLDDIENWDLEDDSSSITKEFSFTDFSEALSFVNKVGDIAEKEGHHPDIHLHGYNNVTISLSTHAIGGLSENDFIMASKIDNIPQTPNKN